MSKSFEFDVTVTVRKRVHVSGPTDAETAENMLRQIIPDMGFSAFSKYEGPMGRPYPVEQIVSNELQFDLVPSHD